MLGKPGSIQSMVNNDVKQTIKTAYMLADTSVVSDALELRLKVFMNS